MSLVGDYDKSELYFTTEGYLNIGELLRREYNEALEQHGRGRELRL